MRERDIFAEALAIEDPAGRSAYLDRACAGDLELRAHLDGLLSVHQRAGGFGEAPASLGGESPEGPIGERPGAVIGPYKLLEQIGEGGFGVVFMAEQTQTVRRKVALKVLKPGMDTRQVVARFEAERQALALMDHANIAHIFDGGQTPAGRPYFVMELVRGIPITEFCDERRLPIRARLELFVDVCQAVHHAHQKGIIHRDIKPSNVLVTLHDDTAVVKVIDFGIAKAIDRRLTEKTLFTNFAQMMGTPIYMSPEQAQLSGLDVDTRSDIYSLGVLLYELITGTTPFDKERLKTAGFDEIRRIIREEEPTRPSTRLSTPGPAATTACDQRRSDPKRLSQLVRGELDWVVMKALEKDRSRRYDSAGALAADVQRHLNDEPVLSCPPGARYRLGKLMRRHKGKLTTVGAILVVSLAGMLVSALLAVRATRAERKTRNALARMTTAQAQSRQALDTLFDNVVETMFAKQPRLDATEKAFLHKVAGLYEDLGRRSGEAAEARFLRAEGAFKVAHLRGLLGEQAEAEAGYRRAEDLLERLASEFPGVPDYRHKLARLEGNLGIHLAELGNEAEAEVAFRRGIVLRSTLADEFPGRPRYRLELANNYSDLGNLKRRQAKYVEAEAAYRRALDLKERLAAEAGAEPMYQLELALGRSTLGGVLREQGRNEAAETLFRQALEVQQALAAQAGAAPRGRSMLASTYHGLGIALAQQAKRVEAETAFQHAVEVRTKLVSDYPKALEYRRDLANDSTDLGYLLQLRGKLAEAEESYRAALDLRKQIVARAAGVPRFRQELAVGYDKLGDLLRVADRLKEAEAAWRDALAVWERLALDLPRIADYHNGLARTLVNLARLHNLRRDFAAAVPLLEQALPHLQTALTAGPKSPEFRLNYRDYLAALARSRLGLADHAQAAATAEDLARFGYDPANDAYIAAGLFSRCLTLADKDARLAVAERTKLYQSYAQQALALLRQAVAGGYKDATRMKQDPDLEPLRARDEFRTLLAGLEGIPQK